MGTAEPPPQRGIAVTIEEKSSQLGEEVFNPRSQVLSPCGGVVLLLVAFLIPISLLYIVIVLPRDLTPKGFSSSSLQVSSLSVEPFNVSVVPNSQITAHWNISFSVTNPYHMAKVIYQKFDASVFYGNEFLGGTFIKPFLQQREETNLVRFVVVTSPTAAVITNQTVNAIEEERSTTGAVNFNVKIHATMYMNGSGWRWGFSLAPREGEMWFDCQNLKVQFSSLNTTTGLMLPGGTGRNCRFRFEQV